MDIHGLDFVFLFQKISLQRNVDTFKDTQSTHFQVDFDRGTNWSTYQFICAAQQTLPQGHCVRHPPNSQAKIRRNRNGVAINYRFFLETYHPFHLTEADLLFILFIPPSINPSICPKKSYLDLSILLACNLSIGLSFYPSLSLKICLNSHLSTTK